MWYIANNGESVSLKGRDKHATAWIKHENSMLSKELSTKGQIQYDSHLYGMQD